MKKFYAEGALLLTTLIWGATFAIIKTALSDISPMPFITTRFFVALLFLLPFAAKIFKGENFATVKDGIILGLFYFLGFASQTIGLNYTTATKSGFITGTFILFTPVFQYVFEKKLPAKANLLGIVFVVIGLSFLSSKGSSYFDIFNELGSNFNLGDVFTLICAVFFALYLVYLDMISKKHNFMPLVFLQIAVTALGGMIFSVFFFVTDFTVSKFEFSGNVIIAIIYTSLLATIITTILQTKYQKEVTPTKAGIIFSFEPIFAAVVAYFALSERITKFGFIGCIFIFTGLLVTELLDKKKNI